MNWPDKVRVSHLRSIILTNLGKYYRPMYFDRMKEFKIEGELIEMVLCYYCDDIATQKDHVYPISALTRDVLRKKFKLNKMMIIVPACLACNMALGDKVFRSLRTRRNFIRRKMRQDNAERYKRYKRG